MAFSSTDIASLTGGFNQQVMLQQQHASMITQQFGGYSPNAQVHGTAGMGDQYSGMMMQTMGNAGMSALGSGRLNGMMGGAMQPFSQAGQMMIGQASYGAQQQQMLDMNLRQAYRHQNSQGGRGFTGAETAGIGSNIRQMAQQRGPSGESTSFEELGQLASNMGRMGMAEGVRSAKDFNEKFKTMLTTVKTIATELGTSLEEAQKVMASMKGSGIFNNQGRFAGAIRAGAAAGNMSTAELSASALMGAQVSRSIGGKGGAGAYAGINTLTNVGSATQAGVIDEESIYNATGLTGAEGRQAMAGTMMELDARFFSSPLGRRALAGMAGKNGKLNAADVRAFKSGTVGTGDTMDRAHRNTNGNRADFIRNTGRLRGEALKEFGGMGMVSSAQGWLESKGVDFDENNDRSMLFFQRKFGVGRDEADLVVKMARNKDITDAHKKKSADNAQYLKRIDQAQKAGSPEEIMKQLEQARNKVNDGLRELGASWYKSMSIGISEFVGKMAGDYVERRRSAMSGIVTAAMRGGRDAEQMMARELGFKYDSSGTFKGRSQLDPAAAATHSRLFGDGKMSGMQVQMMIGSNIKQFREAGYDISGAKSATDIGAIQDRAFETNRGFSDGGSGVDAGRRSAGVAGLKEAVSRGNLNGKGDAFMAKFEAALGKDTDLSREFKKMDARTRGKFAKDMLTDSGHADLYKDALADSPFMLSKKGSVHATLDAENAAIGEDLLGTRSKYGVNGPTSLQDDVSDFGKSTFAIMGGNESLLGRGSKKVTDLAGSAAGAVDKFTGKYMADTTDAAANRAGLAFSVMSSGRRGAASVLAGTGLFGKKDDISKAIGKYTGGVEGWGASRIREAMGEFNTVEKTGVAEWLKGDEGRAKTNVLLGNDVMAQVKMNKAMTSRMDELGKDPSKTSATEKTELEGLRSLRAAYELNKLGKNATKDQQDEIAKKLQYGSIADLKKAAHGVLATAHEERNRDIAQMYEGVSMSARKDIEENAAGDKEVTKQLDDGSIKVSAAAKSYRENMIKIRDMQSKYTSDSSQAGMDKNDAQYKQVSALQMKQEEIRRNGTVAQKKKMSEELSSMGMYDDAARLDVEIRNTSKFERAGKSSDKDASTLGVLSQSLGGSLGGKDFHRMSGAKRVHALLEDMGVNEKTESGARIAASIKDIVGNKSLTNAERGQRLTDLQSNADIAKARTEKQDKAAMANDPQVRKLEEINASIKETTKNVGIVATRLEALDPLKFKPQ